MSSSNITDIEVANAPELSGGGPPSVPSQISVVLVDEANMGGTPRLRCPRDDQDIWLLAGVAKPASVTVYDDSLGSPCIGGMCPLPTLPGGSFRWYLLRYHSRLVLQTLLTQITYLLQITPLAHLTLTLLARLARMLQGAVYL